LAEAKYLYKMATKASPKKAAPATKKAGATKEKPKGKK
jgi:hypothetical protein